MRKHICMMVANGVTSDPRVTKEARSLSSLYQVSTIGMRLSEEISQSEQIDGYSVIRVNSFSRKGTNRTPGFLQKALKKVVAFCKMSKAAYLQNADVYHAHDFEMLPFAYIIAKLRGAQVVYDSHELWVEQRSDFPIWFKKLVMTIEGYLIRRVRATITVNESIARELQKRYGLTTLPVILHNFTMFHDENENASDPKQSNSKIVVLYHGGYIKDRGLEELIKSVEYLPQDCVVRFRGMGPLEKELQLLASPFLRDGRVEFCQPVAMKDLVKEARESDIGIIPYKPTCLNNYYSLPNKLSEYVMAGLAVCASDLPEIRSLNEKVKFGELFDPYDPISIASAINKLVSDKEYLHRSRNNAKAWAVHEGNWEFESKKIHGLYATLLGE